MNKEVELEVRRLNELSRRLKPLIFRRLMALKYEAIRERRPPPTPQQGDSPRVAETINPQAGGTRRHPAHREAHNTLFLWMRRLLRWS
jgi:hypothetical protein